MSETKIISCTCPHEFQDATYGKGQRVHNKLGPKKPGKYACTVCGRENTE